MRSGQPVEATNGRPIPGVVGAAGLGLFAAFQHLPISEPPVERPGPGKPVSAGA